MPAEFLVPTVDTLRALRDLAVALPELPPDSPPPWPNDVIVARLRPRRPGGAAVASADLHYLRNARLSDRSYWLWSAGGSARRPELYVCLSVAANGDVCASYAANVGPWSPEQFLVGEFNDLFFRHWVQQYTLRYPPD